jgi:tetratricopeptide (TPR) repeat protein
MKDIVEEDTFDQRHNPWETKVGNWHFQVIVEWLQCCQSFREKDTGVFGVLSEESKALLTKPSTEVGKSFGGADWELWLSDTISCSSAERCFCVALKHYLGRQNKCASILEEIAGLNATGFEELSKWACQHKTPKALRRNIGIAYYSLQQWDDCVRCLRISEQDENATSALRYLGNALMALRDYDGAIEVFWRMVDMRCDPDIWFRPGLLDVYEAKGDHEAAINRFREAAERDPDNPNPKICLGYACIGKRDYNSAVKIFEEFPAKLDNDWVDYGLCQTYMMARDYHGAIEMLNTVGLRHHRFPYEPNFLLHMYYGAGEYDEAIEALTEAKNFWRSDRFEAYMMKGDATEAIREFEEAIAEDRSRTDFDLHDVLDQYRNINEIERAINTFKTNERLSERNWDYNTALIEAYMDNGEYNLAVKHFESIFNSLCRDDSLHRGIMAYMRKGDFEQVLSLLQNPKVIKEIGRLAAYSVVKWCKANNIYDQAIQLFENIERPFFPWVWHALGELFAGKGDNNRAIPTYYAASRLISVDISFQIALGKVYLENSSYRESIAAFDVAIKNARSKSILTAYLDFRPSSFERSHIRIAIDADFADSFLWYSLAKAYAATSDEENANNLYDAAINAYDSDHRREIVCCGSTQPILVLICASVLLMYSSGNNHCQDRRYGRLWELRTSAKGNAAVHQGVSTCSPCGAGKPLAPTSCQCGT